MNWMELVGKLIKEECRGSKAEFCRRTGFTFGHLTTWSREPSTRPQLQTIQRVESAFGVRVSVSPNGVPSGYEKISPERGDNAHRDYSDGVPVSASEIYAGLPGEHNLPFEELPDEMRALLDALAESLNVKMKAEMTAARLEVVRKLIDLKK